jgi:hypothetical protein
VAKYPESPTTIGLWGCKVTEHLKNRRDGLIARIDALLKEVSILEQQLAAFDIILKDYDENYRPGGVVRARSRKPPKVPASSVTPLLKDVDQRGTLLRILREADASVSTADCARKLAVQIGLTGDDPRIAELGNVLSRDLDKLVRDGRARYAGVVDGQRRLWERAV